MITLKNKYTGEVKTVKRGFSWTSLFFGILVPLFRGDFKNFLIGLAVYSFGSLLTVGIVPVLYYAYMCFKYNDIYTKDLTNDGTWEFMEGGNK